MKIFVDERLGTRIYSDERAYLEKELVSLKNERSIENLEKAVVYMTALCGWWSIEAQLSVLDADTWGIEETLRTGIVQSW